MTRLRQLFTLTLATVGLACGCSLSPQPVPPNDQPDAGPDVAPPAVAVDPSLVDFVMDPSTGTGTVIVGGTPGSVDPPQGSVIVVDLDSTEPPAVGPVQSDGSFQIRMPGLYGDEFRVQVRLDDGGRSDPVDLIGNPTTLTLRPSVRALDACLLVEPPRQASLGVLQPDQQAQLPVVVRNTCAQPVELLAPRWRTSPSGYVLQEAPSGVLAPGTDITVQVQISGAAATPQEELFIEAVAPQADRRPITLYFENPG